MTLLFLRKHFKKSLNHDYSSLKVEIVTLKITEITNNNLNSATILTSVE